MNPIPAVRPRKKIVEVKMKAFVESLSEAAETVALLVMEDKSTGMLSSRNAANSVMAGGAWKRIITTRHRKIAAKKRLALAA